MILPMRGAALISLALSLTLLSACTPRVVTKTVPVEVTRFQRVPIPPDLLAECLADLAPIRNNADLLANYLASLAALEACNAQLKALRELK